jgi:hypothetical protein
MAGRCQTLRWLAALFAAIHFHRQGKEVRHEFHELTRMGKIAEVLTALENSPGWFNTGLE